MAEGLLRVRLRAVGVDAHVHSAGLVTEDRPASRHGVDAMARRGIDIDGHRSRYLNAQLVQPADLVLGMERQHVREVAVLEMGAFHRTFTLPELARLARAQGPRREGEDLDAYLRRLAAGRRPADLLGERPDDEVADPIGRPARDYERTAAQLEELVNVVVDHLFPT
jgi:protein-tyrosine phosphatase